MRNRPTRALWRLPPLRTPAGVHPPHLDAAAAAGHVAPPAAPVLARVVEQPAASPLLVRTLLYPPELSGSEQPRRRECHRPEDSPQIFVLVRNPLKAPLTGTTWEWASASRCATVSASRSERSSSSPCATAEKTLYRVSRSATAPQRRPRPPKDAAPPPLSDVSPPPRSASRRASPTARGQNSPLDSRSEHRRGAARRCWRNRGTTPRLAARP